MRIKYLKVQLDKNEHNLNELCLHKFEQHCGNVDQATFTLNQT